VTEEIPYEDGSRKDTLITMTKEEYKVLIMKEFFSGVLIGIIGSIIWMIV
jgi:hypothetical protein